MNIVPVDFNAMTPGEALWLDFADTQRALASLDVEAGDGIWASDGEVFVGAVLGMDPEYGLVAMPRWRTLVHLDDYSAGDRDRIALDLAEILQQVNRDEARVFQFTTVLDHIAPIGLASPSRPGESSLRRAWSLRALGERELALLARCEARLERRKDILRP